MSTFGTSLFLLPSPSARLQISSRSEPKTLVEVGEGGLGVFDSLEARYKFGEDDALKEALAVEDTAFFDLYGSGGRNP